VGVHHFAGKLLSRTKEGFPGADVKLQEYSVIGHLLLCPGIIFIFGPKYIKNKYLQPSMDFQYLFVYKMQKK